MPFGREFFRLNADLLLFVYGLVFFVLGLGIALQSRQYSRLSLARSLPWLAAFGIAHGLYEWGDYFIPIQATYLSRPGIQALTLFQLILLGGSFACLFEFGVSLLRPFGRTRWMHGVPAGLLIAWLFITFFVLLPLMPTLETWHHTANAAARYFIGFPGGLVAAFGLRRQALQRIAPLNVPHIVNMLRLAGVALGAYAIVGGLIPPPVAFWPGSVLNTVSFEQAVGVPPLVIRSFIGLVLVVTIVRALEVFEVETGRLIEAMEQQQILAAERDRLGRDLHDGAIQTVYTAGLLVESAQHLVSADSPAAPRLEKAISVLNDALDDLRRYLYALRGSPGGVAAEPLAGVLRRAADDPAFRSLLDVSLDLELSEGEALSPARTQHTAAVVREALANAVRHGRATSVTVRAQRCADRLEILVQDNGAGLPTEYSAGYGLRNMHDRARLLNGQLEVLSANSGGTLVKLDIPWMDEQ